MLYPQNGSIANGSRRTTPTAPVAAAVVSEAIVAPRYTPCCQLSDSYTSGTTVARRAPKRIALIGTPLGLFHSSVYVGHCRMETVKRLFGCAAGSDPPGVQGRPRQSVHSAGGSSSPSHQT